MLPMFLHWKRNRLHRHLLFQVQRGGLTGMGKGENVADAFSVILLEVCTQTCF
jgi:hypothetical protein